MSDYDIFPIYGPTRRQAEEILCHGETISPGNWVSHSRMVAEAAEKLAIALWETGKCEVLLDPEKAWVLGLLHDIGRQEWLTSMNHVTAGYDFLMKQGFQEAARVCLTHSFPLQDIEAASGSWEGQEKEKKRVQEFLQTTTYDVYDKLIQLCDGLCLTNATVPLEVRLVEVALRRGLQPKTLDKWRAFLGLKDWFQHFLPQPIYSYLPNFRYW
jgi:putative nucleotidyltransferase with HDIG domain